MAVQYSHGTSRPDPIGAMENSFVAVRGRGRGRGKCFESLQGIGKDFDIFMNIFVVHQPGRTLGRNTARNR